jgi:hypothetical protein
MGEFVAVTSVIAVLCLIVAVFSFWKAVQAAEETRKIAMELSARFDSLEKRKGN